MTTAYEITTRGLVRQATAVMRAELPPRELGPWLARCFQRVYEHLTAIDTKPTGPPFARFTFLADVVAVEAGFPVGREIAGDGQVEPSALPSGSAAVTTHRGRYEDLEEAYTAIRQWIDAHGFAEIGPHWEVYVSDPAANPDPDRWRTDVVTPYRAA